MQLNSLLAAPELRGVARGRAARHRRAALHRRGQAARRGDLDRAPRRSRADVLRLAAAQRRWSTWMRTQRGTSSLRALVYFDEIFGYLPPVANPPSKAPLLKLLKQARAFGLGLVLATQNPVDLDYKALVERRHVDARPAADRARQGARARRARRAWRRPAASIARRLDQMLSSLGQAHVPPAQRAREAADLFETRWTMSYLRGPLAERNSSGCRCLTSPRPGAPAASKAGQAVGAAEQRAADGDRRPSRRAGQRPRPVRPPGSEQYFGPVTVTGGRPHSSARRASLHGQQTGHRRNA